MNGKIPFQNIFLENLKLNKNKMKGLKSIKYIVKAKKVQYYLL